MIFKGPQSITGYSRFVAKTREFETQGRLRDSAIQTAIEWCIRHDILTEYMKKYGRWVKEIFTFDLRYACLQQYRYVGTTDILIIEFFNTT